MDVANAQLWYKWTGLDGMVIFGWCKMCIAPYGANKFVFYDHVLKMSTVSPPQMGWLSVHKRIPFTKSVTTSAIKMPTSEEEWKLWSLKAKRMMKRWKGADPKVFSAWLGDEGGPARVEQVASWGAMGLLHRRENMRISLHSAYSSPLQPMSMGLLQEEAWEALVQATCIGVTFPSCNFYQFFASSQARILIILQLQLGLVVAFVCLLRELRELL